MIYYSRAAIIGKAIARRFPSKDRPVVKIAGRTGLRNETVRLLSSSQASYTSALQCDAGLYYMAAAIPQKDQAVIGVYIGVRICALNVALCCLALNQGAFARSRAKNILAFLPAR